MSGVATQQLLERRHTDNPIVRIEELRRFPLRTARIPPAGTTFVFRSRGGRLSCPAGGYTAGELFWRGPLVLFQVDLAPHPFAISWELAADWPGGSLVAEAVGQWVARDPVTVVAERVSDAPSLCRSAVRRAAGDIPTGTAEPDRLGRVLGGRLPPVLDVDGLRLQDLRLSVRVEPKSDVAGLMRALFATDDAGPLEAWRLDRELARSALAAAGSDAVVRDALTRFAELNERLAGFLPREEEPG
ncbi:hypothetical protein [Actinoplanes sp. NPDC026623]|uniref:hypothetical protein n=1 Tax=Actinoplanes sp. NPDC026623 TaxID=3155610 RepID=UPI003404B8A7